MFTDIFSDFLTYNTLHKTYKALFAEWLSYVNSNVFALQRYWVYKRQKERAIKELNRQLMDLEEQMSVLYKKSNLVNKLLIAAWCEIPVGVQW